MGHWGCHVHLLHPPTLARLQLSVGVRVLGAGAGSEAPGQGCSGRERRGSPHRRRRRLSRDGRAARAVAAPSLHGPGEEPPPQGVTRALRPNPPKAPAGRGTDRPEGPPAPLGCSGLSASFPTTAVGTKPHLRLSIFPFPWKRPGCSIGPATGAGPRDAQMAQQNQPLPSQS